jgi:hypothetical protein
VKTVLIAAALLVLESACIAAGRAEAFYWKISPHIEREVLRRLDPHLRSVVEKFTTTFVTGKRESAF